MSRRPSPVCLVCVLRSVAQNVSWQPQRGTATMAQRRKPSRMVLSRTVAQPKPSRPARCSPFKGRTDSPFGGMNMTRTGIRTCDRPDLKSVRSGKHQPRKATSTKQPFKALKMQRALTPIPYQRRTETKLRIADLQEFDELKLLPAIRDAISTEALRGLDNISPTPIQRLAISQLLTDSTKSVRGTSNMQQYLLAAETGSGKTLAYLLPILDAIKRAEASEKNTKAAQDLQVSARRRGTFDLEPPPMAEHTDSVSGRPRAIILVPSAELVDQVGALAKSLSHTLKFRSAMLSANYSGTVIRNRLFALQGVDLIITTPHLLSSIVATDPAVVSKVTHMVIDEADSLFDRSFAPTTGEILDRATPSLKQLILCSATIPRSLDVLLRTRFPDMVRLTTPKLHSIPRRVQMTVVDAIKEPYRGSKDLACADAIWNLGRTSDDQEEESLTKYMIVFVNTRDQTAPLASYLVRKGIDALALDRDVDGRRSGVTLHEFTTGQTTVPETVADQVEEQQAPRPSPRSRSSASAGDEGSAVTHKKLLGVKVLVTTDIASRGIDTTPVRNVLLYDVPHNTVDFIHRLGRVGRMGRRGRAVVLVGKGDRRDVVKEVRQGMFAGTALI